MSSNQRTHARADYATRALCLAVSAGLGSLAMLVEAAAPAHVFLQVASVAVLYAFAAIFGSRSLRSGLLGGFPRGHTPGD